MNHSKQDIGAKKHSGSSPNNKQYKWNVTADLTNLAAEVAAGKRDEVAFLGIPIEEKTA